MQIPNDNVYMSEFTQAAHVRRSHVLPDARAAALLSVGASTTGVKSVKLVELMAAGRRRSAFHPHCGGK